MTIQSILTPKECEALSQRVLSQVTVSDTQIEITNAASASTEFARGNIQAANESQDVTVTLSAEDAGRWGTASTNRLDDVGLSTLVGETEALVRAHRTPLDGRFLGPQVYPDAPPIFFDAGVHAMAPEVQAAIVSRSIDVAEAAGMIAAGDLRLEARARWVRNTEGLMAYERRTYGDFSLTARTKDGTGSGWGWSGFEDWSRVDVEAVITRAVGLAQRSANPVAVEPGRYSVILEPAAAAALVEQILGEWPARWADGGLTVFANEPPGTNKIGLPMLDRRLEMISDPWDADRPSSTIAEHWRSIPGPVMWFDQGVLVNLAYDDVYADEYGRAPVIDPGGVRLNANGARTNLEDMVASTRRGIWVNRFSHITVMNRKTLLITGTTRDGTFLIENGRITKPIKNLRFTESPFFAFNQLEAWGDPVRASRDVVAPRVMLRDFNFTSVSDAV